MFREYIRLMTSMSIGYTRGSLFPDNEEGVAKVGDGTHRQEISKLAGPKQGIIHSISSSERVVTDKMCGAGYCPSGSFHQCFKLAECEFAVVAVVGVDICGV